MADYIISTGVVVTFILLRGFILLCSSAIAPNIEPVSLDSAPKLVCYYPLPEEKYNSTLPRGLNSTLCTHIILLVTYITECQIDTRSTLDVQLFKNAIPELRRQNPNLKILISNTGYTPDHDFDDVLLTESNRQRFIKSILVFLRKYGFDGVDLDWEFPGYGDKPKGQRHNFTILAQELRDAFESEAISTKTDRFLLSMALAMGDAFSRIYEPSELAKSIDLANLMGYDFHIWTKSWPYTEYNSPLFRSSWKFDYSNINWSANAWAAAGVPKKNIIVGVPTYCRAFQLWSPLLHYHGALAINHGDCESASYTCACNALKNKNATRVFDSVSKVPYLYYGDQWVTYDDEESLSIKTKWSLDNGFGGVMVFSLIKDDVDGVCDGRTKFPLISAIHRTLFSH